MKNDMALAYCLTAVFPILVVGLIAILFYAPEEDLLTYCAVYVPLAAIASGLSARRAFTTILSVGENERMPKDRKMIIDLMTLTLPLVFAVVAVVFLFVE